MQHFGGRNIINNLRKVLKNILAGRQPPRKVSRAEAHEALCRQIFGASFKRSRDAEIGDKIPSKEGRQQSSDDKDQHINVMLRRVVA